MDKMRITKQLISGIFTLVILFSTLAEGFGQASQNKDTACYTKEQVNLSEIATFRDNYIPKEYLPLPENLVYVDLAVLCLIMLSGLFFVLKRKPAKWLTWLAIIAFVYLGILRGGCICPMGLTTNAVMSIINPYQVSLVGLVMFITPLLVSLVAGRVFCTSGCPLGAIQHLIYKKKKDYKIPARFNKYIKVVPILVLLATIYFAVAGTLYLGCELDPYKPVFFTGKAWFEQGVAYMTGHPMESKFLFSFGIFGWLYLTVTLTLGFWVQRPFCRLLCPYSALLGVVSLVSFNRRRIDSEKCTYCSLCVKKCPTQAIVINKQAEIKTVSNYDCIQCNRCSDSCKFHAI
jgi:ferredoxin-type protein NapH